MDKTGFINGLVQVIIFASIIGYIGISVAESGLTGASLLFASLVPIVMTIFLINQIILSNKNK